MTETICSTSYFVLYKHLLFDKYNFKSTHLTISLSISKLTINNMENYNSRSIYTHMYIPHIHIYVKLFLLLELIFYIVCTHQMLTTLLDDTDIAVCVQCTK